VGWLTVVHNEMDLREYHDLADRHRDEEPLRFADLDLVSESEPGLAAEVDPGTVLRPERCIPPCGGAGTGPAVGR